MARVIAACLCLVLLAGCTSVGIHSSSARAQLDFGAPDTVSLCLYLDEGISEQRGRTLIENAWRDEAPLYGLQIKVASVTRWRRPAFMMDGIIDGLLREPLTPACDRILDRKSTRLNSSHLVISYAVFCLKKNTSADARSAQH